jgi:hypothetical protein
MAQSCLVAERACLACMRRGRMLVAGLLVLLQ